MRAGVAIYDHLGWAIAVTAGADHDVIDRRRVELVEPGVPPMPVHHPGRARATDEIAAQLERVRESAERATAAALDALPANVATLHLRAIPDGFPTDLAALLRPPYEARADAVMYRGILARLAVSRGWRVAFYDAKTVEGAAIAALGARAEAILRAPRDRFGPPWTKEHRIALAAMIVGDGFCE